MDVEKDIGDRFMEASWHDYRCICTKCLDWWVHVGPDGGEYDNFGPFTWQQVSTRAAELRLPFTRGVKDVDEKE